MKTNKSVFTCFIIGEDHLLMECAEILLKNEYCILGIISPLPEVQEFSLEHKINYYESVTDALAILYRTDFDYLFSIVNSYILPEKLLNKPKCMAINYHNAPLPSYAGLHGPSWAILNQELTYGITWHKIIAAIDAGDILEQAFIPIEEHETGLSLSVKCYQSAISIFQRLIQNLQTQTFILKPQDITKRSYYNFYQKPVGGALIDWNQSAESINTLCRALDLGHHYHNRLGVPKFRVQNDIFILNKLLVTSKASTKKPGTIIEILENKIQIATATFDINVEEIILCNGVKTSNMVFFAQSHQLHKNAQLPIAAPGLLQSYSTELIHSAKHELFWVNEFAKFLPALLPFQHFHSDLNSALNFELIKSMSLETEIAQIKNMNNFKLKELLLTSLIIYLFRLGNDENVGVGLLYSQDSKASDLIPTFFSALTPFSLKLDKNHSTKQVYDLLEDKINLLNTKWAYSKDIFIRYPELSTNIVNSYPIALIIDDSKNIAQQMSTIQADIIIAISTDKAELCWYSSNETCLKNQNLLSVIANSSNHISILLNSLLHNFTQKIIHLPFISLKEYEDLTTHFNRTPSQPTSQQNVLQLFTEQVNQAPDNIALSYSHHVLTYRELDDQSTQMARQLQKENLSSGKFAAICTNQEAHLIIGLLAILKSGAAYIPIDSSYPESQIQYILGDSNPVMVLASKSINEKIYYCCKAQNIQLLFFETIIQAIEEGCVAPMATAVKPDDLAYVIYTSGTTGKPKGVLIPHKGIVRLVKNTNYIQINPDDKIAQAASISFDAATFEIWGALLNGATLVEVPQSTLVNVTKFGQFIKKNGITILWLTSALFNQFASQAPSIFKRLRYLLVGGDVINPEMIFTVMHCKEGSPEHILNGYGPTENTTFTTTYRVSNKDSNHLAIPIGKPISNTTVYILDDNLQPCPIGVPGELYTGGEGLAKGYLNNPLLTNERFVPCPFDKQRQSRLYKTGDLVRWLPNGNIDYLGRKDNQVKIRGFRIELEAIKTVLLHHPLIKECTVTVVENFKHQKSLVAYVALKNELAIDKIQAYMAEELPSYMIPSYFVLMDKMPLTTTGKINFNKLPRPDFNSHYHLSDYVAPKTLLEQKIAGIWETLFHMEDPGVNDSFFNLGGDSLRLTQLIFHIKQALNFDLPLPHFLEKPTIANLAELINHKNKKFDTTTQPTTHFLIDKTIAINNLNESLIPPQIPPKHILLTGATGFLGSHLLANLCEATHATIHCLIRCHNLDEGQKRIDNALNNFGLKIKDKSRIIPVPGDLSLPHLGLNNTQWTQLENNIDLIIHNGAEVNHLYSYDMLRRSNVLSVKELIHLAAGSKRKNISFVSTLSAAVQYRDHDNKTIEDFIPVNNSASPTDGYNQSKWIAEQLLNNARLQGLSVKIYRPSWILGNSKHGVVPAQQNHLLMLIKGCIQLQYAPAWDIYLDILPVDYISQIITQSSINQNQSSTTFNLTNPNSLTWKELIAYLMNRGYKISLLPIDEWREKHFKCIGPDNALYPLLPIYLNNNDQNWMKNLNQITYANHINAAYIFKQNKLEYPIINQKLLDIYFTYLEKQGFIQN